MNISLGVLLESYRQKRKNGLIATDRQELEAGQEILQERLRDPQELDSTTVHQATELYFYLADRQGIVDLCTRYLTQPLSTEEKAWAWWELIDNLCLLLRSEEAVASHHLYLDWAHGQWEQNQLSSRRLLMTIIRSPGARGGPLGDHERAAAGSAPSARGSWPLPR